MKNALNMALAAALFVVGASQSSAGEKAPPAPGFKPYPLDICLVGGEKLTSMGAPFAFKYEGRIIKFCCQGCIEDFKKDHDKFMARLAEADKKASASKPAEAKPSEHKH